MRPYADRRDAGRQLAPLVADALAWAADSLVLALPRGGVPVGAGIAELLGAPLDVIVVRKVAVPGHAEVAWGAVASVAGTVETVDNADLFGASSELGLAEFEALAAYERDGLARRERLLRGVRPPLEVSGRTTVIVDDGVATGASMRAAVQALRRLRPARILIAVPVCLPSAWPRLSGVAEVVCPWLPSGFMAVGQAYRDFDQTSDREVQQILAAHRPGDTPPG